MLVLRDSSTGWDTLESTGDTLEIKNIQMTSKESKSQQLGKAELQCGIYIKWFRADTFATDNTLCLFFLTTLQFPIQHVPS